METTFLDGGYFAFLVQTKTGLHAYMVLADTLAQARRLGMERYTLAALVGMREIGSCCRDDKEKLRTKLDKVFEKAMAKLPNHAPAPVPEPPAPVAEKPKAKRKRKPKPPPAPPPAPRAPPPAPPPAPPKPTLDVKPSSGNLWSPPQ